MKIIDNNKHYSGHRERLRKKFRDSRSSLSDYEILELFLFSLIPYKDTRKIAKNLLSEFKSFENIIFTNEKKLCEIEGIGKSTAFAFNVLGEFFVRKAKQKIEKTNLLNSWDAVIEYCRLKDGYNEKENVRILFLNKKNHLISDEVLFSGTVDETSFYSREIIKRSLELNAVAIIIIHNHPSGNTTPSNEDIEKTIDLIDSAKTLRIKIHDHIIVSKDKITSMKALGLIA